MLSRLSTLSARLLLTGLLVWPSAGALAANPAPVPTNRPPNRLIHERSLYLRQHADNPVDWYPWGDEAFARAKKENKPIFLSIGYSTCHWCHVMAQESFSNPEIAQLLNEKFICIKVDREERPDLDRVYLTFVQASTGGGGWPMSVWLTPDLKPFFGGTYFPPEDRDGRPGFKSMLTRLATLWSEQHEQVLQQSDQMLAALAHGAEATASTGELPLAALRDRALAQLQESFDAVHGGFEGAPKFPLPVNLEFLFDVATTSADAGQREASLRLALSTLRAMAAGGIHDHLGGGFHRYAVDAAWRVPHFEKMLYDQAQLANVYLTGWQLSGDPALHDAATDTLDYVRRQLLASDGGFYTAEDADSAFAADPSAHGEGAFYVWTEKEIIQQLGAGDAGLFAYAYGVLPDGNVTGESAAELAHQNVLYRAHTDAETATHFKLDEPALKSRLAAARQKLVAARAMRPRPLRDDKIVTAWNGLAISAFARAAQVDGDPRWAETATQAAVWLQAKMFDPASGRLAHSYREGSRDERGFVEDYAFLIQGLLDLYETNFEVRWLEWAGQLQETQNRLFADEAGGGYFANAAGDASVLLRLKEENDGPEPSANSIAVRNLARLGALLHQADGLARARRCARAFGPQLEQAPQAMPLLLAADALLEGSPQQILIQGERASPATARLLAEVWSRYLPRRSLVLIDAASRPYFSARVPLVADLPAGLAGEATAYVCENFVCQLPTQDPVVLAKLLSRGRPARP
ncbi:MAG: thioredoxin domain-containing protein [Opitutae bacterium]